MVRVVIAGLLGGVAAFVWGFLSWEVLGLHNDEMLRFANEGNVAQVIEANIPTGPGLYVYPNYHAEQLRDGESPEELAKLRETFMKGEYRGLFIYAAIGKETGDANMMVSMAYAYGANFMASLLLAMLLCWAGVKSIVSRVVFVEFVAVFTALAAVIPPWIWWPIPDRHSTILIVDLVVAWGLAGIVIALVLGGGTRPESKPEG